MGSKWLSVVCVAVCFMLVTFVSAKVFEEEILVVEQVLRTAGSNRLKAPAPGSGCECISKTYDCGCCIHMEIESVDLNDTGCVNVTYLPDQYGISLTFSLDGHVLINQTISAKNPPPVCFGVPYLKDVLSLCIDFYNLDIHDSTFYGCIKVEARVYHVLEEDWDLGCFKIGPHGNTKNLGWSPNYDEVAQQQWLQELTMMQEKKRMKLREDL